jgi:hypothetical protein
MSSARLGDPGLLVIAATERYLNALAIGKLSLFAKDVF